MIVHVEGFYYDAISCIFYFLYMHHTICFFASCSTSNS